MEHKKLELQDYFIGGHCTNKMAKLIFKARSQDKICIGCEEMEESGEEIMLCEKLNIGNRTADIPIRYNWFFSDNVYDLVKAGKVLNDSLKRRQEILDIGIT